MTVGAALILMSCSGKTTAYIAVDLLTYFESEERVVEFVLPSLSGFVTTFEGAITCT